jgi:hypothetical protein
MIEVLKGDHVGGGAANALERRMEEHRRRAVEA